MAPWQGFTDTRGRVTVGLRDGRLEMGDWVLFHRFSKQRIPFKFYASYLLPLLQDPRAGQHTTLFF